MTATNENILLTLRSSTKCMVRFSGVESNVICKYPLFSEEEKNRLKTAVS